METDYSIPEFQRFIEGLQIINKYENDPQIAAEHDIFYCGDYDASYNKMSESEYKRMHILGWFAAEDSWAFYP